MIKIKTFFVAMFILVLFSALSILLLPELFIASDSIVYLKCAENFANGKGLVYNDTPLTHYPPGYSISLSIFHFFPSTSLLNFSERISFLAILNLSISLLLIAYFIRYITQSNIHALLGAFIFVTNPATLHMHSQITSEALFMNFFLATVTLVQMYLVEKKNIYLILGAIALSLSIIIRYVGVSIFISVIAMLCFTEKNNWKQKAKDVLTTSTIVCIPLLLWFIRNLALTNNPFNREPFFEASAFLGRSVKIAYILFHFWFPTKSFPLSSILAIFSGATVLLSLFLLYKLAISQRLANKESIIYIFFVFSCFCYISFVFASAWMFDKQIGFSSRMFYPISVFSILFFVTLSHHIVSKYQHQTILKSFVILLTLSTIFNGAHYSQELNTLVKEGKLYNNVQWKKSNVWQVAQSFNDKKIYSNNPRLVSFYMKRKVFKVPHYKNSNSLRPNKNLHQEMSQVLKDMEQGNSVIIFFPKFSSSYSLPNHTFDEYLKDFSNISLKDANIYISKQTKKKSKDSK